MTTRPTARNTPLREESPASCGTSPPSDIAPTGHADGGPFFHPAGDNDNESCSFRISEAQFSRCAVKRADSLMNFAEAILTSAVLADRASQNLLHRVEHLNASVRAKYGPNTEHHHAETAQELSQDVFA